MPWENSDNTADNRTLWARQAQRWNENFGPSINSCRESIGLPPVTDVQRHILTDQPWLAADPTLGRWRTTADLDVVQTGAWIAPDHRPLSRELQAFLDAGEPPIYFGFGSMRARQGIGQTVVLAARALNRRAIVSRGSADVALPDDEPDCLSIGEENLQALFKHVAAAVHHGGAGTAPVALQAGAPQVVVPQIYDQHYWAARVHALGIGIAHRPGVPDVDSLTEALRQTLQADIARRAREVTGSVRVDGAEIAARLLIGNSKNV